MKPVIIIAIAVVCSVIAVFGVSEISVMLESYSGIQKNVNSITCQVWINNPDTNKPRLLDEYDQECLEFEELSLIEKQKIIEKEIQEQQKRYEDDDLNTFLIKSSSMRSALDVYDHVRMDSNIPFENVEVRDIIVFNRPSDQIEELFIE